MNPLASQTIVCQNLEYRLEGSRLLSGVNAEFQGGQINVILGQNGAGKSTLLKLIAKSSEPSGGEILWQGKNLQEIPLGKLALKRAVVEQQQRMLFDFTVQELVGLGLEVQLSSELVEFYQGYAHEFAVILERLLETFDLIDLAERSVLSLSGGEFQRVQLARAMAQIWPLDSMDKQELDFSGRWLLMDEWNAALDMRHQQCFSALLRQWCQQKLGVIMVVHDLPLAFQLAEQVMILKKGRLFIEGKPEDVLQQGVLQEALEMQTQTFTAANGKSLHLPVF